MAINVVSVQYGGPSFNRASICRRPDSHTCFFLFFPLVSLEMSLFPSIFCTISAVFLVWRVRRTFFPCLPNGVFQPCDHRLDY